MKLSNVDLNLLLVLHALLDDPSVSRAARRLHVTPPAVSNALGRLRAVFDDPLFVRSGRGLAPTPFALALAPALSRAIRDLEGLVDRAPDDPAATTRTLTIALADADQIASLSALAAAVGRALPRAHLRAISIDTLVAGGGLAAGAADVAVAPAESAAGLHAAPLYEEEGVLIVRRGHPLDGLRPTLADFARLRHVDIHLALGRGGAGHAVVEHHLAGHGVVRDVAVTVPTFVAAAMVVAATDLVSGLPRRVAERLAQMVPIAFLAPPIPPPRFRMQLLWHERTAHDPVAGRFRELVIGALTGG